MNLYWLKTWNLYHPVKQRNKKTQIQAFNHSNNKTRVNFFLYDVHSPSNTTSLWSYLCQILLFAFQLYATPPPPYLFEVGVDWLDLGFPHSGHFEYSRLLFTLSRSFLFILAHGYILCLENKTISMKSNRTLFSVIYTK